MPRSDADCLERRKNSYHPSVCWHPLSLFVSLSLILDTVRRSCQQRKVSKASNSDSDSKENLILTMADLVKPNAPTGDPQAVYDIFRAHNSGLRIHTDTTIQAALLSQYPSYILTSTTCDLIDYAQTGHAIASLIEDVHPTLRSRTFEPAARQPLDGSAAGRLVETIVFGRYDYIWQDHSFQVFVVEGQNSGMGQCDRRCYVLYRPEQTEERDQARSEVTEALILAASIWSQQSHEQVWVYDQGRWSKDKELWRVVQSGNWEDVILEQSTKRAILRDVIGFFDARETYEEYGTVWKVRYLHPLGQLLEMLIRFSED